MARISTYPTDNNITLQDKVLGSDNQGLNTKNYTFEGIVNWFNASGAVAILGQNNYFFQSLAGSTGRSQGTISFDLFGGVGTSFSDITTFKLSKDSVAGYTLEDYLPTMVGKEVILAQLDNLNNFGIYTISTISIDIAEPAFYNVSLSYNEGSGALELDKFYGLAIYAGNAESDKTYIFNQVTPSTLWVIQHNLNKYPSVTSVNSNNVVYYGNVVYVDANNLTVEFSAGFSGKAYLN